MLRIGEFLKKRKEKKEAKKIVMGFGGPTEIKKVGPASQYIHGKVKRVWNTKGVLNTYEDAIGQKLYKKGVVNSEDFYNLELESESFISALCFNLHLAQMIKKCVDGSEVYVSVEPKARVKTITMEEFQEKYPEKMAEYVAVTYILSEVFSIGDRNSGNQKFYTDGTFLVYDLGGARDFLMHLNTRSEEPNILRYIMTNNKLVLKIIKEKLLELKGYYNSESGIDHFKQIYEKLDVKFGELYPSGNKHESTPALFYSEMLRKIDLFLKKMQEADKN